MHAATITVIASRSPQLERLVLRSCTIDDNVLGAVAAACPRLRVLEFGSGNPFGGGVGSTFSARGISSVLAGCPGLEHLVAVGSGPRVTDAEAAAALSPARSLRTVDVSGNTSLGDGFLAALGRACPAVSSLGLFRCEAVSLAGLSALPLLEVLDVSHCPLMQLEDLANFVQRSCPRLQRLVCTGVKNASPSP
jgi:hypothetical protein